MTRERLNELLRQVDDPVEEANDISGTTTESVGPRTNVENKTVSFVDTADVYRLDPEKTAEVLGLPENEEVLMVMDLGYAAEGAGPLANHGSRKDLAETVSYM